MIFAGTTDPLWGKVNLVRNHEKDVIEFYKDSDGTLIGWVTVENLKQMWS